MARLILIVTWMCVTGVAMAAPNRMTGDDIQRAMKPGALLEIDTPLRISIPVKVSTDGIVSANAGALGLTLGEGLASTSPGAYALASSPDAKRREIFAFSGKTLFGRTHFLHPPDDLVTQLPTHPGG